MKSKLGISKQLFIALSIVNLSVTLFSVVLGYVIYNYAIEKGWISLSSLQEDWTTFHFVDWIWLATVIFSGCMISLVIGMHLAKRFIVPINFLAEAAKKLVKAISLLELTTTEYTPPKCQSFCITLMTWPRS